MRKYQNINDKTIEKQNNVGGGVEATEIVHNYRFVSSIWNHVGIMLAWSQRVSKMVSKYVSNNYVPTFFRNESNMIPS